MWHRNHTFHCEWLLNNKTDSQAPLKLQAKTHKPRPQVKNKSLFMNSIKFKILLKHKLLLRKQLTGMNIP